MLYKIYDWDQNLAGYFFPEYGTEDEQVAEVMNKTHQQVVGSLLVPMVKLGLLDSEEGMDVDYVVGSLEANLERTKGWKQWLQKNGKEYGIANMAVYTAREDRNMLSINLAIDSQVRLGEKEVTEFLTPLLNMLHEDGLL